MQKRVSRIREKKEIFRKIFPSLKITTWEKLLSFSLKKSLGKLLSTDSDPVNI